MKVQEFQNKLKEIQTIAKANGNSLTAIQIRDTFAGMELDKTQLLGVLKYLTSQGIQIEGMEDSATEETKEPERKKIPLTPEEETYLRNYLEELPELSIDTAQAFGNERGGGEGVRTCGIPRVELFVVSKVAAEHKTYEDAARSINDTLENMGLDYLDMMIIHSPQPWVEVNHSENRKEEGNRAARKAHENAYKAR